MFALFFVAANRVGVRRDKKQIFAALCFQQVERFQFSDGNRLRATSNRESRRRSSRIPTRLSRVRPGRRARPSRSARRCFYPTNALINADLPTLKFPTTSATKRSARSRSSAVRVCVCKLGAASNSLVNVAKPSAHSSSRIFNWSYCSYVSLLLFFFPKTLRSALAERGAKKRREPRKTRAASLFYVGNQPSAITASPI